MAKGFIDLVGPHHCSFHCSFDIISRFCVRFLTISFRSDYKNSYQLSIGSDFDLVALETHGHKGISDVVLGSVSRMVKHHSAKPILLLRGEK